MLKSFFLKLKIVYSTLTMQSILILCIHKLLPSKRHLYTTKSGIKFWARDNTPDLAEFLVSASGYEYPFKYIPLEKNLIIVDVGGHIGSWCLTMWNLLKKYEPRIISIEPENDNFELLTKKHSSK